MRITLDPSEVHIAVREYLAKRGMRMLDTPPTVLPWDGDSKLAVIRCDAEVAIPQHDKGE